MDKLLLILMLSIVGCAKQPTIVTEYKEVEVPVYIRIHKPDKPKYTNKDNMHTYLIKVINYTKSLESIIDEYNKGISDVQ